MVWKIFTRRRDVVARKARQERILSIYHICEAYPGRRPGFLASLLGLHRSEVTRSLPILEEKGYLLSEDERGGLWPFRKKK
jgi:DNA-binding MarR family transcriptional regulator